jgi:hypothetical protein
MIIGAGVRVMLYGYATFNNISVILLKMYLLLYVAEEP